MALDQPNFIALNTIATIAEQVSVQPSTMIRFSKEFGYDGFSDLQRVFRYRLIEGAPVYREQVYEEHHAVSHSIDLAATMQSCINAQITALKRLKHEVAIEDLAQAIDMIVKARHVYIAGQRRSRPIATYLAYGLTRLELHCTLLDFGGGMAAQQVANMNPRDLLIAVAFTPYSAPVVDLVRDAGYRERSIIAITDSANSALARNAQVSFFTDYDVSGQFRPISGSIGLVQAIIEGIGAQKF
jgi:DNA-binding MurR/RpiR family transcriptional regulator